jgi:hypothetical protein
MMKSVVFHQPNGNNSNICSIRDKELRHDTYAIQNVVVVFETNFDSIRFFARNNIIKVNIQRTSYDALAMVRIIQNVEYENWK